MQVVEINVIGTQPREARLALSTQGFRATVDHFPAQLRVNGHAAFARQKDRVALAGQGLADNLFIGRGAVESGGIEVAVPHVEGLFKGAQGLWLGHRLAVTMGEVHAAQSDTWRLYFCEARQNGGHEEPHMTGGIRQGYRAADTK